MECASERYSANPRGLVTFVSKVRSPPFFFSCHLCHNTCVRVKIIILSANKYLIDFIAFSRKTSRSRYYIEFVIKILKKPWEIHWLRAFISVGLVSHIIHGKIIQLVQPNGNQVKSR